VVGGSARRPGTGGVGAGLIRLTTDGSLDASFGASGKVIIELTRPGVNNTPLSLSANFPSLTLQPDGKIVAAGGVDELFDTFGILLMRFNP
jgi:Domain of unknown function (DUF5122) beta-propeller